MDIRRIQNTIGSFIAPLFHRWLAEAGHPVIPTARETVKSSLDRWGQWLRPHQCFGGSDVIFYFLSHMIGSCKSWNTISDTLANTYLLSGTADRIPSDPRLKMIENACNSRNTSDEKYVLCHEQQAGLIIQFCRLQNHLGWSSDSP